MSLCKRRGFIWPSFELYGGVAGMYDYGPLGCSLRNNIVEVWRSIYKGREGFVEIDSETVNPREVFKASGHVDEFADLLTYCTKCQAPFRADHLVKDFYENADVLSAKQLEEAFVEHNIKCPDCGGDLGPVEEFNLMFKTHIGPGSARVGYLRPETAQGIFVNFPNLYRYNREKMPLGVIQTGRSYRNEIAPRQGMIRMREFNQMEVELFVDPEDKDWPRFHEIENETLDLIPNTTGELVTMTVGDGQGNVEQTLTFSLDMPGTDSGYPTVLMQHVPPRIALKKTHRPAVRNRYLTLLKHTSRVQVLLPSFQEEMRAFCPNIPITCIGNTVDQLPPRPPHSNDHPPVVLSVGRLDENKNQLFLIRAFDLVRRQIPDARLILCGDNADSKYGLACRAETAALGLEQNITFHPPTTNLVPLYHQADIYASASLFEGWGLTVTEAMSVGLPVVGLKSADGVNALVQDGTTGFLTDNDPRDFAQALLRLIHSPDDRRRFGHAARRALHAFAPDTVWAQWDCLLRSVAFPKKSTKKD